MPPHDLPGELFELAPVALIVANSAGVITQINKAAEGLLGFDRQDLVGRRSFLELLAKGSQLYFETYCLQVLLIQGSIQSLALKVRTADGRSVSVLANARLDHDSDGAPGRMHFAFFDASGRLAYEQQLLAAKRRAEASEAHATTLARTLQTTLIPPSPPVIPGLDIAAAYRSAGKGDEVGGDFYDIFELDTDEWVVVIGDVSGKGAEAAVVTALARDTVRAASVRNPSPAAALRILNDRLLATESERFCTAIVLRLRRRGDEWDCVFAIGGHSPPLLTRAESRAQPVGTEGSLVGGLASPTFRDSQLLLRRGDLLLMCTDGVSEGRHRGEFFGDERIAEIITRHPSAAGAAVDALLDAVLTYQQGDPRDDIAIIALRVP